MARWTFPVVAALVLTSVAFPGWVHGWLGAGRTAAVAGRGETAWTVRVPGVT